MTHLPNKHILLVEDDFAHAELVQRAFENQASPVRLTIASTLAEARARIAADPPTLILADWRLPDGDGVELLFQRRDASEIPVVIMTSYSNERSAVEAIQAGALDYIVKTKESLADMPHIAERAIRYWTMIADKTQIENELRLRADAELIWRTIGKTIVSNQTLDQVLTTVIQIVNDKLKAQAGAVLLSELDPPRIRFAKILHENNELASAYLQPGEGVVGWVIANGQSALVPDVTQDPRWQSRIDAQTGFTTRSILCVPLIAHNETIGAVELINKQTGDFTDADQQLLESIAAPLAIAIQNARLQQQVHHHLDDVNEMFDKVETAKREWEQTVDAIDAGIWLVDSECRIIRANRTLADWLGTNPRDLVGQLCYQAVHHSAERPRICPFLVDNANPSQDAPGAELQLPHLAGGVFRFNHYPRYEQNGALVGSVNLLRDITTERALQSQLMQSEKLGAIGRLAGSIAHEVNNPLQALQGCLDLALANPTNIEKQQRYLNVAKNEVERLAVMVRRMLDFYRPSKGVRGPVDLRALTDEVLTLSNKRLQHARVTPLMEWEDNLPVIHGIGNQLKQVLLNLVLNAVDSMPTGGDLRIRGRVIANGKTWIVVEITDTGVGIPPDQVDKIFEPFYTTKPSGTGLGLGISHTIISSHGGKLTVDSAPGKGSTFTIWLPAQK